MLLDFWQVYFSALRDIFDVSTVVYLWNYKKRTCKNWSLAKKRGHSWTMSVNSELSIIIIL